MREQRNDPKRLNDILQAIDTIFQYVEGLDKETFLAEHKRFHTVPIDKYLPEGIYMDDEREESVANGMITLLPNKDKCEGFFICRMERDRKED